MPRLLVLGKESVFRYDRWRWHVEEIIHANFDGVIAIVRVGVPERCREARISEVRSNIVEFQAQVFNLGRPVRENHPLDAATRSPACADAGRPRHHASERGRARAAWASTAARDDANDRAVSRNVGEGKSARSVEKNVIPDISDTTANGAEVVRMVVGLGAAGRSTSEGRSRDTAAFPIGFPTDQPVRGHLPIVAGLETTKDAFPIPGHDILQHPDTIERVDRGMLPAIANVCANIKPVPIVRGGRDHRRGLHRQISGQRQIRQAQ